MSKQFTIIRLKIANVIYVVKHLDANKIWNTASKQFTARQKALSVKYAIRHLRVRDI